MPNSFKMPLTIYLYFQIVHHSISKYQENPQSNGHPNKEQKNSPDMLIRATNFPNSKEIPRSCSWNLAVKNFLGCCCCCCCCCLLLLRLPLLGRVILLGFSPPFPVAVDCGPPITIPLEQWPLLTPGVLPDLKSLCNDKKRTHTFNWYKANV